VSILRKSKVAWLVFAWPSGYAAIANAYRNL
jgi:hypothetical protein